MSSWVGPAIQAGGAILGGMAGGKGSKGSKPPKWLRQQTRDLASFGSNLAQQEYTPYTGERVAGFSPDTLAAFDMIRSNMGAATPAYQQAMQAAQGLSGFQGPQIGANFTNQNVQTQFDPRLANASQWAGQSLDPYMNPYTSSVIDANMADQQNAYLQADNALRSQAGAANAFGNSRFGVAQGQLAADAVRNQSLMSAQLRSQGFNTAAGLLSNDVDRQNQFALANQAAGITADQMGLQGQMANQGADLQRQQFGLNADLANQASALQAAGIRGNAANSLGFLGGQYQNMLQNDASNLGAVGSAQQALQQQQYDVGYGNYLDQTRQYPTQQLNWWSSALSPAAQVAGMSQPGQSGGLLGTLGGAQIGSQIGGSIYDWWKNRSGGAPAYSSYDIPQNG